jgi:hypothetical protein
VTRVYVELGEEAAPVLVRWSSWLPGTRPGGHDSYALCAADGVVLVDPRLPAPDTAGALWGLLGMNRERPVATVLTNDWHERDCYALRDQFGAPVWGPAAGRPERGGDLEGAPDAYYEDGDALPGGLRAFAFDGRMPGDALLVWRGGGGGIGVVFSGDCLNGQANPDNPGNVDHPRRRPGLYVGAARYYLGHPDPNRLKTCLGAAAERAARATAAAGAPLGMVCGAHGRPFQQADAAGALRRLLDLDWGPFLAAEAFEDREHPAIFID